MGVNHKYGCNLYEKNQLMEIVFPINLEKNQLCQLSIKESPVFQVCHDFFAIFSRH